MQIKKGLELSGSNPLIFSRGGKMVSAAVKHFISISYKASIARVTSMVTLIFHRFCYANIVKNARQKPSSKPFYANYIFEGLTKRAG